MVPLTLESLLASNTAACTSLAQAVASAAEVEARAGSCSRVCSELGSESDLTTGSRPAFPSMPPALGVVRRTTIMTSTSAAISSPNCLGSITGEMAHVLLPAALLPYVWAGSTVHVIVLRECARWDSV